MSALSDSKEIWSLPDRRVDSKYEKCRNITEEIYKRINITFQIKKLESSAQSDLSDHSDQIDSNELSNETDLFACDKSDSIRSSSEAERPQRVPEKYVNINNNEETKNKTPVLYKRPRKRFRKRVKKRQSTKPPRSDTECSSDEALPLSRIIEVDKPVECPLSESPDNVMGVPNIVIVTRDLKPKIINKSSQLKESEKKREVKQEKSIKVEKVSQEWKSCAMCSLSFRGERGLRRHMTMSHIVSSEDQTKSNKVEQRDKNTVDG